MAAVVTKDLTAIRRSKAVVIPMLAVPFLLLVILPFVLALASLGPKAPDVAGLLKFAPPGVVKPILSLPQREQLVVLVNGYLVAPLFLIVPLMVASVLAADAFAGEKDRRTLEGLLHLPISDGDLFFAKVVSAFAPAVAVSWLGFVVFALTINTIAWPVMHRIFIPTKLWGVMIFWLTPAVAAFGMGVMVRVSARARTTQEANQLGGAVILPLIFASAFQATGLLLVRLPVAFVIGGIVWILALELLRRGARRFTRDRMAAAV
jgi:ABC-type Na+ efflux pump permease subunit